MPIPRFDQLLLPLLQFLSDGKEHALKEAIKGIEDALKLPEEEKAQMLPSGAQRTIVNRTGWARTFLKKAEFIESPRRGFMKITARGKDFLAKKPTTLTVDDLKQFPEFEANWHMNDGETAPSPSPSPAPELTPEERIDEAFGELRNALVDSLLEQIAGMSPAFFERLVIDVLLRMGYGSSLKEAGKAIGRSGDGGIDGIINEDKLGLDVIYIQAKRWENTVGRPEIQKFMGALAGNRARKGVFITTSSFTKDARDYANSIDAKIVLMDGNQLAKLMIEHDVGVTKQEAYIVKKIDADYFSED